MCFTLVKRRASARTGGVGGSCSELYMGLARELQWDFERWQAAGRSDPVLAGFVWEGNVLWRLPEATWVGRAWPPAPLLQGLGMEHFPLSPPWFSWLQNEYSDSCLVEERRGSGMVFPEKNNLKSILHTEICTEAVLSPQHPGFSGVALRAFFFSRVLLHRELGSLKQAGSLENSPKERLILLQRCIWHF